VIGLITVKGCDDMFATMAALVAGGAMGFMLGVILAGTKHE